MSDQGRETEKTIDFDIPPAKSKFFTGVAVLTVSALVVKLIGLLYKIPMMRSLGEEGMGYFNSAYEIYTFFYILATAGLPIAESILVAENMGKGNVAGAKRVFRVSMAIFLLLGLAGTAALYFGAGKLSSVLENSGAELSIKAISPMILFVCVASGVKGYFQGLQNMIPTAVSQAVEAAGKLILGLSMALWAVKNGCGIIEAAAYATLGITVGTGISMIYLVICKMAKADKKTKNEKMSDPRLIKSGENAKRIIKIAIPITVSSAVVTLTRVVDLFMILRRLQAIGYTESAANAVYGSYSTLAVSMFNLPAAFVAPIALSLVPVLTSAVGAGDKYKESATLNSSLRLTGLITIPASLGLSAFSRPILELVFRGEESAVNIAAPVLSVLGLSAFFSCMITVTNAVLQGYGRERFPLVSMVVGSLLKVVFSYFLIGIPSLNVYGAAISTFLCAFAVTAMNLSCIKKCSVAMDSPIKLFGSSLGASAVSVALGMGAYFLGEMYAGDSPVLTLLVLGITAIAYALLAIKLGAIREADILLLPKGDGIYGALKKIRLIK